LSGEYFAKLQKKSPSHSASQYFFPHAIIGIGQLGLVGVSLDWLYKAGDEVKI